MRFIQRLLTLTLVLTASAVAESLSEAPSAATLQLRGVLFSDGAYKFILTDGRGDSSGWVKLHQEAFGYTLVDFAPATDTVTVVAKTDGQLIQLRLATAKVADLSTSPQSQPTPSQPLPSTELPAAVRTMMFPNGDTPLTPVLAHPKDAAPSVETQVHLPAEIARYFPASPSPKWEHPDTDKRAAK